MTNKEAIKILKNYHNGYFGYKIDDVHEAHDLAIKALEFTESQRICCDNCVNRNIKSEEVCNVPFGECEFFNATKDHSLEIAQKSIELGRSLGRTEERVESKRSQGEWIPVTYRPMTKEEEKELCEKWGVKELEDWERRVFTCPLPEDEQEILISTCWGVCEDVCSWDDGCIGLADRGDWDGVDAWMPKPERYKKGDEKE